MIEKPISISEVYTTFKNSRDGQHLNLEKRYGRYIKSVDRHSDNYAFSQTILGVDINNLKHLQLTRGLTQVLANRLNLTETEKYHLNIAAIIHDMPEARCKDTTHSKKTPKIAEKEFDTMKKIANEVLFVDDPEKADFIINIYENIVKNSQSKLGEIFHAGEHLGYLRTGLRAYKIVSEGEHFFDPNFIWITHSTLSYGIPTLTHHSLKFAPVKEYLVNNFEIITQAFMKAEQDFPLYISEQYSKAQENVNDVKKKFEYSCDQWITFSTQEHLKLNVR
jgi:hypothetical protein